MILVSLEKNMFKEPYKQYSVDIPPQKTTTYIIPVPTLC